MTVRETIDIEALLVRAYWEKAVDRLCIGDERSQRALGRLILMGYPVVGGGGGGGDRVDTSSWAANQAARERALMNQLRFTDDPLLALHDAVLDLPDFFVEATDGLDFVVWCGETAKAAGQRIDAAPHGRFWTIQAEGHAPRRLTRIVATTLLIQHGRHADRPEPSAVIGRRGRALYDHRKHVIGYETEYDTPLDVVVQERAEYAVWHACLDMLAQGICLFLAGLDVKRPSAPVAPWVDTPDVMPLAFERPKGRKARPAAREAA